MREVWWPEGPETGYPQHPDAHPLLPWWRLLPSGNWRREPRDLDTDAYALVSSRYPDFLARMIAFDREHPRPAPPPKVGQIWRHVRGKSLTAVDCPVRKILWLPAPSVWFGDNATEMPWSELCQVGLWLLVAGPHSPWVPLGYLDALATELEAL